jgi:hypothetical protein
MLSARRSYKERGLRPALKVKRLFAARSVCGIIRGFYFGEPLHGGGVNLGDLVLEADPFDFLLYFTIPEEAFHGDELAFLESLGELGEIPPCIDAVPFGAVLVPALGVLPAFLRCDVEGDVFVVVLRGFGFCVLSEAADEDNFVEHGVWLRFLFVRCLRYKLAPRVCRRDPLPR